VSDERDAPMADERFPTLAEVAEEGRYIADRVRIADEIQAAWYEPTQREKVERIIKQQSEGGSE